MDITQNSFEKFKCKEYRYKINNGTIYYDESTRNKVIGTGKYQWNICVYLVFNLFFIW